VPKSNGQTPAGRPNERAEASAAVRTHKPPPPEDDDEQLEEEEPEERSPVRKKRKKSVASFYDGDPHERPAFRKRRKKKKKQSNTALIVGLIVVGVLVLAGGGAGAAYFLGVFDKKPETAASSGPPPSGSGRRFPGGGGGGPSDRSNQPAETKSSQPADSGPESSSSPDGRQVFQQQCSRCHRTDGSRGGRGPNLSAIGQSHDEDWFVAFVRNPKSQKPDSRGMPSFDEGKLSDAQLKAVAKYLASLK
jgi:mono/diheme cytochrome c family protein